MITALRTVVPPAVPAVSIALATNFVRVDYSNDDTLLALFVQSATEAAQAYLNRALITQTLTWVIAHDERQLASYGWLGGGMGGGLATMFPGFSGYGHRNGLKLPRAPLQSVLNITRLDPINGDVVLDPSTYAVMGATDPGRVQIAAHYAPNWSLHGLAITYSAGYGDTPASIPARIIQAICLDVANSYQNRGDTDDGASPEAFYRLLDPYRLDVYA